MSETRQEIPKNAEPDTNDFGHLILRILGQNRKVSRIQAQIMAEACQDWEDKHVEALFMLKTCRYNLGNPDKIYVSDLTRELHDTPQSVSRLLRMLEQEELIERHSDPEDRRKTYILFTETGERAVRECWERLKKIEDAIQNSMGIEQLSRLCEDYEKMIRSIETVTETFKNPDKLRLPPLPAGQGVRPGGKQPVIVKVPENSIRTGAILNDERNKSAEEESAINKKKGSAREDPAEKNRQDSKEERKNKKGKNQKKSKKEKLKNPEKTR